MFRFYVNGKFVGKREVKGDWKVQYGAVSMAITWIWEDDARSVTYNGRRLTADSLYRLFG